MRETLAEGAGWLPATGERLVGIGGTVRNLAAAAQRRAELPSFGVQGFVQWHDRRDFERVNPHARAVGETSGCWAQARSQRHQPQWPAVLLARKHQQVPAPVPELDRLANCRRVFRRTQGVAHSPHGSRGP